MSDDLHSWALRGIQNEIDRIDAGMRKLETDRARDRLLPVIRERIGDPKRAREAFDAFIACDEYGRVDPSDADEKRLHVWLSLAASSEPFRKAVEAPKTEPVAEVQPKPSPLVQALYGGSEPDAFVSFILGRGGR